MIDVPLTVDDAGTLYSYDDLGNVDQTLDFATAHIDIPEGGSLSFLYTGSFGDGTDTNYVYGPDAVVWTPTHSQPPTVSPNNLSVAIFGDRKDHQLSVRQPDANGVETTVFTFVPSTPEWNTIDGWTTFQMTNDFGGSIPVSVGHHVSEWLYSVFEGEEYLLHGVSRLTVAYDAAKPFHIFDDTTGEAAPANTASLSTWYGPNTPKGLAMSSSRWGHDLWLRHPDGGARKVRQHATQGSLSLTASGAAWWVSFDWFDAEVLCRDFMSWRLEDRDTDEVSAFYAPGDAPSFVTWRAVPSPRQLAASPSASGIVLTWMPGALFECDQYIVERSHDGAGAFTEPTWQEVYRVPGGIGGVTTYWEVAPPADTLIRYRIRAGFEGRVSAPSNVAIVTDWNDSDGDGLPDLWEFTHGLNWKDPTDATADTDGDGASNLAEFLAGTDPLIDPLRPPAQNIPSAPQDVLVSGSEGGGWLVTWTDTSDNEDYFVIYQNLPGVARTKVACVAANQTSLSIPSSLTFIFAGSPNFSVAAGNSAGQSAAANGAVEEAALPMPDAPQDLQGTVLSKDRIRLTWSGTLIDADSYVLFRAVDNQDWVPIPNLKASTYLDETDIIHDVRYKVSVAGKRDLPFMNWTGPPSNEAIVHYAHVKLSGGSPCIGSPAWPPPPAGFLSVTDFIDENLDRRSAGLLGPFPGVQTGDGIWHFYKEAFGHLPRGRSLASSATIRTYHEYEFPYIACDLIPDLLDGSSSGFLPRPAVRAMPAEPGPYLLTQRGHISWYDAKIEGEWKQGFDDVSNPIYQMVPQLDHGRQIKVTVTPSVQPPPPWAPVAFGFSEDANLTFSKAAKPDENINTIGIEEKGGAEREVECRMTIKRSMLKADVRTFRGVTVRLYRVKTVGYVANDSTAYDVGRQPPEITDDDRVALTLYLNKVFAEQANVWSRVTLGGDVNYVVRSNNPAHRSDDNGDGACDLDRRDPLLGEAAKFVEIAETDGVDFSIFVWNSPLSFREVSQQGKVTSPLARLEGVVDKIPGTFAFVSSMQDLRTIAHEIGHLLGLHHTFTNNISYGSNFIPDSPNKRLMGYGSDYRLIKPEWDIIRREVKKLRGENP